MPAAERRRYAKRLRPSDRREQVLDAALQLVLKEQSFQVTMEGVAAAAGVTKPVVYDYFANRDGLLAALLDREVERAFGALMAVVPNPLSVRDMDPDELLVDRTVAFLDAVQEEPDTWRLLLLPPTGAPPELRAEIERRRDSVRQGLRLIVTWGRSKSSRRRELDVDLFTHMMLAVGERAAELVLSDPDDYTPERVGELIRVVFAGARER